MYAFYVYIKTHLNNSYFLSDLNTIVYLDAWLAWDMRKTSLAINV